MELTMSDEWKDKYFEEKFKNLGSALKGMDSKLDENTKLTEKNLSLGRKNTERILRIEAEVFNEQKPKDLPPFYKDPKVVQVILFVSLTGLLIVAALLGVDVRSVL